MDVTPTYGCLVIRERNDQVQALLLRHEPVGGYGGAYALPARRARDSESPREAAANKLGESTGLDVQPETLKPVPGQYESNLQAPEGEIGQIVLQVFVATNFSGTPTGHEDMSPQWIEVGSVPEKLPDELVTIIDDGAEVYRGVAGT